MNNLKNHKETKNIVRFIIALIKSDSFAISFQTMGQYRAALIKEIYNYEKKKNDLIVEGKEYCTCGKIHTMHEKLDGVCDNCGKPLKPQLKNK